MKKPKRQKTDSANTEVGNKQLAAKTGLPYQTLMNSYLTDCAIRHVELIADTYLSF